MNVTNSTDESITRQDDEVMALKEIYGEDIIQVVQERDKNGTPRIIKLSVVPAMDHQSVEVHPEPSSNESSITIQHLPKSTLEVTLCSSYPDGCESAPEFIFSCVWLNEDEHVKTEKELNELWESTQAEILFTWIQFMTELVAHFNLTSIKVNDCFAAISTRHKNGRPAEPKFASTQQLFNYLKENSFSLERETFQKGTHDCEVCAEEYTGKECVQFEPCKHIFCSGCTKEYYTVNVKDGSFTKLKCLSSDCESEPTQNFIKELLDADVYEIYESQQLKVALDSMEDVFQCPRNGCETPVIAEPDSNLARCQKCFYSFCKLCLRSYHGVELCKVREDKIRKIREAYEKGDLSVKLSLEHKYGKKQLMTFVNESRSLEWVTQNSKCCPGCHIQTQKTKGCNKMWCARCGCHWCWICNSALRANDPYSHFSKQNSQCYQKLFDGMTREELMAQFEGAQEEEPHVLHERPNHPIVNDAPYNVEVYIPPDALGLGHLAPQEGEAVVPLLQQGEADMLALQLQAQLIEDDDFHGELRDDGLLYFGLN